MSTALASCACSFLYLQKKSLGTGQDRRTERNGVLVALHGIRSWLGLLLPPVCV